MKMEEQNKLRPPYASSGQVEAVFNLFRTITPKKVDSKLIVDNGIATPTNAFKVVDFIKWIGICDAEGNLNGEIANKLKLVGEQKDLAIVELIKKAYKDIFDRVNLETAKKENITNLFISDYGLSHFPAKFATDLFIHLCQKYNIPINEEMKKKSYLGVQTSKKRERKPEINNSHAKKTNSIIQKEESGANENEVLVKIIGKLKTELKATNQEELEDILNNKLPDIFKALKLFLPEKSE